MMRPGLLMVDLSAVLKDILSVLGLEHYLGLC